MATLDDGSDGYAGLLRLFNGQFHRQCAAEMPHPPIVVDDRKGRTLFRHGDLGNRIRMPPQHPSHIGRRIACPVRVNPADVRFNLQIGHQLGVIFRHLRGAIDGLHVRVKIFVIDQHFLILRFRPDGRIRLCHTPPLFANEYAAGYVRIFVRSAHYRNHDMNVMRREAVDVHL